LDAVECVVRGGGIVNAQENTGGTLEEEQEKAGRAKCVPPVAFRFGTVEGGFIQLV
jgi:hypothetical protein